MKADQRIVLDWKHPTEVRPSHVIEDNANRRWRVQSTHWNDEDMTVTFVVGNHLEADKDVWVRAGERVPDEEWAGRVATVMQDVAEIEADLR